MDDYQESRRAMSNYQGLLDKCHKPFAYYQHEFLQNKFIYVRIQDTVLRLNSLEVPWSLEQGPVEMVENPDKTSGGKTQYDALTYCQLTIEGMGSRGAPGASTSTDKDNAAKAAHSFALRKASSLFGISQYLMVRPAENGALVRHLTSADMGDLTDLKKAVTLMAKSDGINDVQTIFDHYKVTKANLSSVEGIINLLTREGRI